MPYLIHPTERLYPSKKKGGLGTRAIEITTENVEDIAKTFDEQVIYKLVRGGSRVRDGFLCDLVVDEKMKLRTRRKVDIGDFVICMVRAKTPVMSREHFLNIFEAEPVDWWKP